MASGYSGYPGYPGYLLPFFIGKMLLIIYNIIKLLYIAQFQKINTRGVTEVTEVTRVLIKLLTQEADWGCRLPRLPRLPPAFFYRENAFNNIIILLNSYI